MHSPELKCKGTVYAQCMHDISLCLSNWPKGNCTEIVLVAMHECRIQYKIIPYNLLAISTVGQSLQGIINLTSCHECIVCTPGYRRLIYSIGPTVHAE